MSFPLSGSDAQPGGFGLTANSGIPGMTGRTQDAVTEQLKSTIGDGHWGGLGGGLVGMVLSLIAGALGAVLGGFATFLEAIFNTVNDPYIANLPTITDHSQSITTLQEQFEQVLLQGTAIVFTSNNTYTPTPGIHSIDVIIIGAGGGGSSGSFEAIGNGVMSGGGGGGGGETHTSVPASLLPVDGTGNFKPIQIIIGAGGAGALADQGVGTGGGHSKFGPEVGGGSTQWLLGGGGNGGAWGPSAQEASGGVGMLRGGHGGAGIVGSGSGFNGGLGSAPGDSVSAYDLHGGGGGGAAGNTGFAGGSGGISPGGAAGNPGAVGSAPASIIATGGGGGGGGISGSAGGGAGGFPAGGGGGSACGTGGATFGGNGGNGICFIIERSS